MIHTSTHTHTHAHTHHHHHHHHHHRLLGDSPQVNCKSIFLVTCWSFVLFSFFSFFAVSSLPPLSRCASRQEPRCFPAASRSALPSLFVSKAATSSLPRSLPRIPPLTSHSAALSGLSLQCLPSATRPYFSPIPFTHIYTHAHTHTSVCFFLSYSPQGRHLLTPTPRLVAPGCPSLSFNPAGRIGINAAARWTGRRRCQRWERQRRRERQQQRQQRRQQCAVRRL